MNYNILFINKCIDKGIDINNFYFSSLRKLSDMVLMYHKKCKRYFKYQGTQFYRRNNKLSNCPLCAKEKRAVKSSKRLRKDNSYFINRLDRKFNNINVIKLYKGRRVYIDYYCSICNKKYHNKRFDHILNRNCYCTHRVKSYGEKYIKEYLDNNHIKYEPQKTFDDLKDKLYLSYDFYLPEYKTLIEYQGKQHYELVSFSKNNIVYSDLKKQQYHDKLKREYAQNNGYKLLEIPYTIDNFNKISKVLNDYIHSCNGGIPYSRLRNKI